MANETMQFSPETKEAAPRMGYTAMPNQDTYPNSEATRYYDRPSVGVNNPNTSPDGSFRPEESAASISNPQSVEEAYQGSFLSVLEQNLGYYVVIDFLIGTTELISRSGILYAAGNNFVTLYEPDSNHYVVCDLFSIKFVTFYPGYSPYSRNGNGGYSNSNPSGSSFARRVY